MSEPAPAPAPKRTKLDSEASRRYSEHQYLHELVEWVLQAGGHISEALELYKDEQNGFSARIRPGKNGNLASVGGPLTLVSCPTSLIFSLANPNPSLPALFLESPSLSIHAKACFHLSQHLLLKEQSQFWPYIRLLPKTFDTPLYFNDDEMERLAGTNLGAGDVLLRKQLWMEEWEAGKQFLEGVGAERAREYTWDLFLRAATIYTSRSFPSKLVGITMDSSIEENTMLSDDNGFPVLIPLVDILNHKPNTKIIWEPTQTSFSLITPETISEGSQVFNNYGPKGNEELLMGYGFVIPENPGDSLAMKFTISPRGQAAQIWEQRALKQTWREVFHLTKSADSGQKTSTVPALESDWPEAFVDLFRILVANENEIDDLENGDINATPISIRNELAVALGLKAAIKQKLAAIRKYDISLSSPAAGYRETVADIYRKGQEDIIVSKIQKLDSFLECYAKEGILSVGQYLNENPNFAQQLGENPIPVEELEGADGPLYEEIIAKEELVFIIAILQEFLDCERVKTPSSRSEAFWRAFVHKLHSIPGMPFEDFARLNEVVDDESEGVYAAIADYCNSIEREDMQRFIGQEVNSLHITWAWGIVRAKCITVGDDTLLTL
ncbi:hypothetical protein AOL_s00078g53 [Orbilia oligospora ATCC 24927]|uniref:Uncharacterized protein n=1 Tax=Arthrobotrys oligospora (strain ATCC 24927 / CBS 115.81 / DSM 1491) TaxID=756982 RepID=G1XAV6_ARTOA|nr:hypothetical protein AOL_s00078g53 [Orbilia oligospora ATCC 24927]EGX49564.1 hypothetical protein AOL_s00078g53 [Orbilia oligospora ATCC 24927]